jgi:hypothetical protein
MNASNGRKCENPGGHRNCMRWVALLLLIPLAGCLGDSPVGNPPEGLIEGDCGGVYHRGLAKQILLDVSFTQQVLRDEPDADVRIIEVAAETNGRQYAKGHPDADGCLRLPMQEDGVYTFWGFGFRENGSCWYSGYVRGIYDGDPVVEGTITLSRSCP